MSTSKKEKERNHKYGSESVGTNNSSSASISTISITKREFKDSNESKSNNSSIVNLTAQTAQNLSKDAGDKKLTNVNNSDSTKQIKGRPNETNSSLTSSISLTADDKKNDSGANDSKSENVDKVSVKVEPIDSGVDITKKVMTVTIGGSADAASNHKSPTSRPLSSTTFDKSKVDLKILDGKPVTASPPKHPGFGRVGAGKVGLDRQSVAPYNFDKSTSATTTSSTSITSSSPSLKDSPAKIIPLLPSVTVTSSSLVKVDLKSSSTPATMTTSLKRSETSLQVTPMDVSPSKNERAGSPPRINTELLG